MILQIPKQWLYFLSGIHGSLWRVGTTGGNEIEVTKDQVQNPAFSPDGKSLAYFFREKSDSRLRIRVVTSDTQTQLKTFELKEGAPYAGSIAWMNDNKSFYYIARNKQENLLWRQSIESSSPQLIANIGSDDVTALALSLDQKKIAFIRGRWIHEAVLIEGLK